MNERLSRKLFSAFSSVTDVSPKFGASCLNYLSRHTMGSDRAIGRDARRIRKQLATRGRFDRFLVLADLNIGDAVTIKSSVHALRDFFPEARIDYAVSRYATPLVVDDPEISRLLPIFASSPYPSRAEVRRLKRVTKYNHYDVILSFCPYFSRRHIAGNGETMIDYMLLGRRLASNSPSPSETYHVVHLAHRLVHDTFASVLGAGRRRVFTGATVILAPEASETAAAFLHSLGLSPEERIILYNPDASSRFSRVPFDMQVNLLKSLTRLPHPVLLGAGHTEKRIEVKLLDKLTTAERRRVMIVPAYFSIDTYAALIDLCDLFITPDTGPTHIAAARKSSSDPAIEFRNRTAVFTIFGASPPRIYGYDSEREGFYPANQDAPSRVYIAGSPCRNITCINKKAKTCRTVRCFEHLEIRNIHNDAGQYLAAHRIADSTQRFLSEWRFYR
jgi:ADP-heptose:LPS heptosyltransferase